MSEIVYARSRDVVWRLGPDRVLVRRIGDRGENAAAELLGEAALVWTALDEPGTLSDVERRLAENAAALTVPEVVDRALELDWLTATERD